MNKIEPKKRHQFLGFALHSAAGRSARDQSDKSFLLLFCKKDRASPGFLVTFLTVTNTASSGADNVILGNGANTQAVGALVSTTNDGSFSGNSLLAYNVATGVLYDRANPSSGGVAVAAFVNNPTNVAARLIAVSARSTDMQLYPSLRQPQRGATVG